MRNILLLLSRGLGISPDNMTFEKSRSKAGAVPSGGLGQAPAAIQPGAATQPDWANGLRQLYESVVDEPIPDTFKDLLSKLDTKS